MEKKQLIYFQPVLPLVSKDQKKELRHGDCSEHFWGLQELLVPAATDDSLV